MFYPAFFLLLLSRYIAPAPALILGHDLDSVLNSYDFIVCGCGIGGLVIANRLSEDPSINVLCIEAGEAYGTFLLNLKLPAYFNSDQYQATVLFPVYIGADIGTQYDWNLTTVPQTQLDGNARPLPQGKVLGGGSILNGMVWSRGGADDYDAWESLGNTGWNWDSLLPYFMKSETYTPYPNQTIADQYSIHYNYSVHGYTGPVQVSYPPYLYPQSVNFYEGLNSLGIPTAYDPCDGNAVGAAFSPTDLSPENQTRSDARITYYDPVATRPNLHLVLGQQVTRLIIEDFSDPAPSPYSSNSSSMGSKESENIGRLDYGLGGGPPPVNVKRRQYTQEPMRRIIGVEFACNSSSPRAVVFTNREVIMSAGALHTPQILQLSGIGPANLIASLGIPVAINLPGVGSNLQDHPLLNTFYPYNNGSYPSPSELVSNSSYNAQAEEEYLQNKTGPWTAGAINAIAFPSLPSITNLTNQIIFNASTAQYSSFLPSSMNNGALLESYNLQRASLLARLNSTDSPAYEIINNNAGALTIAVMHPLSRGSCAITSDDPFLPPSVDPSWLSDPTDRAIMLAALEFNSQILATPAMQLLQPGQVMPPADSDDVQLQQFIDAGVRTEYHVSGTTAMMPASLGGVVDTELRVYGTENLRVVDAGVFPMVPGGHLQAVVYAVAEKAADIIKLDAYPYIPVPSSLLPTSTTSSTGAVQTESISVAGSIAAALKTSSTESLLMSRASSAPTSSSLAAHSSGSHSLISVSQPSTLSTATLATSPSSLTHASPQSSDPKKSLGGGSSNSETAKR